MENVKLGLKVAIKSMLVLLCVIGLVKLIMM